VTQQAALGMKHLAGKILEMVRKAVDLMEITDNFLRGVMQRAAGEAGEKVNGPGVKKNPGLKNPGFVKRSVWSAQSRTD